ncbi:hypothetical protein A9R05_21860 [Burkholderia sp. KK1]|nr:hypothetical protein A9R05_21860 [Burkholderia sp. KK1]
MQSVDNSVHYNQHTSQISAVAGESQSLSAKQTGRPATTTEAKTSQRIYQYMTHSKTAKSLLRRPRGSNLGFGVEEGAGNADSQNRVTQSETVVLGTAYSPFSGVHSLGMVDAVAPSTRELLLFLAVAVALVAVLVVVSLLSRS